MRQPALVGFGGGQGAKGRDKGPSCAVIDPGKSPRQFELLGSEMVRYISAPVAVGVTGPEVKLRLHEVPCPKTADNVTGSAGPEIRNRVPTWKVAVPPFSITKLRGPV